MLVHLYIYDLQLCDTDKCVGFGAVFRISFALAVWFALHALLVRFRSCARFDVDYWLPRILLLLGLLVVSYLIPSDFYDEGYVQISRVFGGLFLLLQVIVFIDFAVLWNKDWTSEEKQMYKTTLAVALVFYLVSLAVLVLLFVYFADPGCGLNKFFIAWTLIGTFFLTVMSVSAWISRGGILPAAVVTLYSYYLAYDAMASDPGSCNPVKSDELWSLIVGLVLSALSITKAAYTLANSQSIHGQSDVPLNQNDDDSVEAGLPPAPASSLSPPSLALSPSPSAALQDEAEAMVDPQRSFRFHFIMMCAAMYMSMLLTGWGSSQEVKEHDSKKAHDLNLMSMWIKIITQWVTHLVYGFYLLAPKIFPDRDFDD